MMIHIKKNALALFALAAIVVAPAIHADSPKHRHHIRIELPSFPPVMAPWKGPGPKEMAPGAIVERYGKLAKIQFDDGGVGWARVAELSPKIPAGATPASNPSNHFVVGDSISAPYSAAKTMYRGKVGEVYGKLIRVDYDDGSVNWALASETVHIEHVQAPWKGTGPKQMYPGAVVEHYGKLAKIQFDDGSVGWAPVIELDPPGKSLPTPKASNTFTKGQSVLAPYSAAKKMYPGKVGEVYGKLIRVDYDDGAVNWALASESSVFVGPILNRFDPRISDVRKKLFAELDLRIPSKEGVKKSPPGINLFDGVPHQTVGTTCGLLPGVLMKKLGVKGIITNYATEGVRMEGRKLGVWVESDGINQPIPGDIYVLRYPDAPETDSVAHVGVIYEVAKLDPALGEVWVTADSGQGSHDSQEANFVNRQMKKMDGVHPFLSGPKNTPGDSDHFRRIGGWINLDKLLALP